MITYEKLKKLNTLILSERLIEKYKYKKKYFTRKRQINSEDVIYFTLNKRGLSLRMEMNKYKEMSGRLENTSKSAICQQRKKIKPGVKIDLY